MSDEQTIVKATAASLRYAASLAFASGDEELAESLYDSAKDVDTWESGEADWCCPVCQEIACDDGCPMKPKRMNWNADRATAPGETIAEWLEENGHTNKWLATQGEWSQKFVSELLAGKVRLTPHVADRIERITHMSARLLLQIDADYQLFKYRSLDISNSHEGKE